MSELENAVERAVILADSGKDIEAELLGISEYDIQHNTNPESRNKGTPSQEESMVDVERKHIKKVLKACDGNRTHASKSWD